MGGKGGCGCIVIVAILLLLSFGLSSCIANSPSPEERWAELSREVNQEAEQAQREAAELKSGIRLDSKPVSGLSGGESSNVCLDGYQDDTSAQGILDIDEAEASIHDGVLTVITTLHPVLKGNLSLSGSLQLTSNVDSELWVSYSSYKGRIGTDSLGDHQEHGFRFWIKEDGKLEMSVPVDDFSELGERVSWQVSIQAMSLGDQCPNEGRAIYLHVGETNESVAVR